MMMCFNVVLLKGILQCFQFVFVKIKIYSKEERMIELGIEFAIVLS